jgi:hypothetical protein
LRRHEPPRLTTTFRAYTVNLAVGHTNLLTVFYMLFTICGSYSQMVDSMGAFKQDFKLRHYPDRKRA